MTQFLLTPREHLTLPSGFAAPPVPEGDVPDGAHTIFGRGADVVQITPVGDEMDVVVDRARAQVLQGAPVAETELGELLAQLGSFALFWASDYDDLPQVSTLDDLWRIIDAQIRESNWELYVVANLRHTSAVASSPG